MANTHDVLANLVAEVKCKPGWAFELRPASDGPFLSLVISVDGPDSRGARRPIRVQHWHAVPEATYNRASWARWLFERCRGVENHELGEWFDIGGRRPFQPLHGPGELPYEVWTYRTEADARTTQDGTPRDVYHEREFEPL